MKRIAGYSSIFLFFCFFLPLLQAEVDPFTREYYLDISGYHSVGQNSSESREEAVRLAKAEAIKRIFSEIGKDALFQQMFISIFPQFIVVDASGVTKTEEIYTAKVKITIDQNAVIMMEEQYRAAVEDILNQGEATIQSTEKILREAETAEVNLRMSEAMLSYRSAVVRCQEIEELFKNIGDSSIHSNQGNSILVLKKIAASLRTRSTEGVNRLEELENELEKDSALEELMKTLELILAEIGNTEEVIKTYADLQPFFDLPKTQLENIKLDLTNALEKTDTIGEKLTFLTKQVPEERLLVKEKVNISLNELARIKSKLTKMKKDVEQEMRYPRLVRQQHSQNWKNFLAGVDDVARYLFLHKSADILSFRWYPPFFWEAEGDFILSHDRNTYIRAEKAFEAGFWIRTQLTFGQLEVLNRNILEYANQELAMGYFRDRILFGAGLCWDWNRTINDAEVLTEKIFKIYFGGVDRKRTRANWLLFLNYQIPRFMSPFRLVYQVNGELGVLLRVEEILLVETSLFSGTFQDSLPGTGGLALENLEYGFNWRLGLGLRFPGPFVWGVYYNLGSRTSLNAIDADEKMGAFQEKNYWGAYIEYSF